MKGNMSGLLIDHSSASVVGDDFVGGGFCVRNDLMGYIERRKSAS